MYLKISPCIGRRSLGQKQPTSPFNIILANEDAQGDGANRPTLEERRSSVKMRGTRSSDIHKNQENATRGHAKRAKPLMHRKTSTEQTMSNMTKPLLYKLHICFFLCFMDTLYYYVHWYTDKSNKKHKKTMQLALISTPKAHQSTLHIGRNANQHFNSYSTL